MFKTLKKYWNYAAAKLSSSFDKHADPEVQLNQAISEAKAQHNELKANVTTVIANRNTAELELNSKMEELEKVNAQTRQAVKMAADAEAQGDSDKAAKLTSTAEVLAGKLIELEASVEDQKQLVLQSTEAAEHAKAALDQNATQLQKKIAEKSKLLSKLDQAKMQESVNSAMDQLNSGLDASVPSLKEVESKINDRYARATAATELTEASVESQMQEIERATANEAAKGRLAQIKAELALPPGEGA